MSLIRKFQIALLLGILSVPAFLNIKDSHNWGGDFAMYILQARNIVEGRAQLDNGYVYAPETHYFGPPAYPVGFPLALSAVYRLFGNSIYHFNLLIGLMVLCLAWLSFRYFQCELRDTSRAFVLTAIFVFNPWLIAFKSNVLSDIQFSLLGLGVLYFEEHSAQTRRSAIFQGVCLGLACSTRSTGIAFLLALLIPQNDPRFFRRRAWCIAVALAIWVVVTQILFPIRGAGSYLDSMKWSALRSVTEENMDYYLNVLRDVVPQSGPTFVQTLLWSFMISAGILGFLRSIRKNGYRYRDGVMILYFMVLFVWPGRQGYRFLLPIAPILLLYYREFGSWMAEELFPTWVRRALLPLTLALFASIYHQPLRAMQSQVRDVIDGPQEAQAAEAFERVRALVPPSAIVLFRKPRPLALYAGCRGLAEPWEWTDEKLDDYVKRYGATYVLIDEKLSDKGVQRWAGAPARTSRVWRNARYLLYRIL